MSPGPSPPPAGARVAQQGPAGPAARVLPDEVAVVVLAGGEGSRIGGGKPLRRLGGERLIDRAVKLARTYSDCVAVAVRDSGQAPGVDTEIIEDDPVEGPLGGVVAALRFARAAGKPLLLLIPADTPFLPADLLSRLSEVLGDRSCALSSSGGRAHPMCSLWRTDAAARIAEYVATGRRSMHGFAEAVGTAVMEWGTGEGDPFFNINSADDLAAAERRLAGA